MVLTCAHRFCWGCLVAHFAALRNRAAACPDGTATADIMDDCSLVVLEKMVAACEDEQQQQSFYPCPCCRKPQVLNIESLQVRLPWPLQECSLVLWLWSGAALCSMDWPGCDGHTHAVVQ